MMNTLGVSTATTSLACAFLVGSSLAASDGSPSATPRIQPNGPDPRDKLIAIWKEQKSAVVTGRYRVDLFRHSASPAQTMTREHFRTIIESLDIAQVSKFLAELRGRFPSSEPDHFEFWGVPMEIFEQGAKLRNNWQKDVAKLGHLTQTYLFNTKEEVHYDSFNKQAQIFAGRTPLAV